MRRSLLVPVVLATLVIAACSKPPRVEFDAANAALAEAEEAGAPEWAPAAWTAAQRAMDAASAELDEQKSRSLIGRSYDEARRLLLEASDAAREATAIADAARETAREEADAALVAIDGLLASIDAALERVHDCSRRPASFTPTLANFEARRESLRQEREDLQHLVDDEAYLEISARSAPLRTQAEALHAQLASSLESLGC